MSWRYGFDWYQNHWYRFSGLPVINIGHLSGRFKSLCSGLRIELLLERSSVRVRSRGTVVFHFESCVVCCWFEYGNTTRLFHFEPNEESQRSFLNPWRVLRESCMVSLTKNAGQVLISFFSCEKDAWFLNPRPTGGGYFEPPLWFSCDIF